MVTFNGAQTMRHKRERTQPTIMNCEPKCEILKRRKETENERKKVRDNLNAHDESKWKKM